MADDRTTRGGLFQRLRELVRDVIVSGTSTSGGVAGGLGAGTRRSRERRKRARDASDSSSPESR